MAPVIEIKFDNESKIFFPGQNVKGLVILTVDYDVDSVDAISFEARGTANTSWSKVEPVAFTDPNTIVPEEYYKIRDLLWGDGSIPQTLNAGVYNFNFSYDLPRGIPASFESKYGYVRHTVKAEIDLQNECFKKSCIVPLSIGTMADLNENPLAKNPIKINEEKSICCLCCKGGYVSFTVDVDHTGYVPGENIFINAVCINNTDDATEFTKAELIQKIKYKISSDTQSREKTLCEIKHPPTPSMEQDVWTDERLGIPPVPPSGLPGCSIIDVTYKLEFTFAPSGMSLYLMGSSEIIIGTVPLHHLFGRFVGLQSTPDYPPPPYSAIQSEPYNTPDQIGFTNPTAPPILLEYFPPSQGSENHPNFPRPFYKETPLIDEDGDRDKSEVAPRNNSERESDHPFAPNYVTYGWNIPPPK